MRENVRRRIGFTVWLQELRQRGLSDSYACVCSSLHLGGLRKKVTYGCLPVVSKGLKWVPLPLSSRTRGPDAQYQGAAVLLLILYQVEGRFGTSCMRLCRSIRQRLMSVANERQRCAGGLKMWLMLASEVDGLGRAQ